MNQDVIMAIRMDNRRENAELLQRALTNYGCTVKMRLGLHEAGLSCSNQGLILLQLVDEPDEIKALEGALNEIPSLTYKTIRL